MFAKSFTYAKTQPNKNPKLKLKLQSRQEVVEMYLLDTRIEHKDGAPTVLDSTRLDPSRPAVSQLVVVVADVA